MKVFAWQEVQAAKALPPLKQNGFSQPHAQSAITIGGFDGPHAGHAALFGEVLSYKASHAGTLSGVITFLRPPAAFKNPHYAGDVSTFRLKKNFFQKIGFDFCIVIDFSLDFCKMRGRDFLDTVRKFCSMQFLVAGVDFRLGRDLDTGVAELSEYAAANGLELKVLGDVALCEKRVSSSLVRGAVLKGDFDFAKQLLGRPYCLDGFPLRFKKEGSSNSSLSMVADKTTRQVLPERGCFPVSVVFGGEGFSQNANALLRVESSFLRLEFPLEQNSSKIEKIEFL